MDIVKQLSNPVVLAGGAAVGVLLLLFSPRGSDDGFDGQIALARDAAAYALEQARIAANASATSLGAQTRDYAEAQTTRRLEIQTYGQLAMQRAETQAGIIETMIGTQNNQALATINTNSQIRLANIAQATRFEELATDLRMADMQLNAAKKARKDNMMMDVFSAVAGTVVGPLGALIGGSSGPSGSGGIHAGTPPLVPWG